MALEKQDKAIDLTHHLSALSLARAVSPLKGLQKYLGNPNLIQLAGGLPSPAYFPFADVSGEALVQDSFQLGQKQESSALSWLWRLFAGSSQNEKTMHVSIPKYSENPLDVTLSTALQYGPAVGIRPLQEIIQEFSAKMYKPAYEDFTTLVHTGNTDGWHRVVATLCNSGEGILAEEWTYVSAMNSAAPYGVKFVPVAMDGQGMRSDDLCKVLSEWDETARGMKRPHVMYIVPVGQNPSGATMSLERKKAIYDICVQFDIIIVEDDPYYFLQEGPYVPKKERKATSSKANDDQETYIASLVPSFLRIDYQGRVIRLDTFSKTIAPGSRLGWFTCNPMFAERLEREGESNNQSPCGFGQSLVTKLLQTWKYDGYIRWLRGLGAQYTSRRDHFVDLLADEFDLRLGTSDDAVWEGSPVYLASSKRKGLMNEKYPTERRTLFSFVPPTSGMFVWLKLNLDGLPPAPPDEEALTPEMRLFVALAEAGVLMAPGAIFSAHGIDNADPHFRISFSSADLDQMKKAVKIFGRTFRSLVGDE